MLIRFRFHPARSPTSHDELATDFIRHAHQLAVGEFDYVVMSRFEEVCLDLQRLENGGVVVRCQQEVHRWEEMHLRVRTWPFQHVVVFPV